MRLSREIRRCALLVLYQLDAAGEDSLTTAVESLRAAELDDASYEAGVSVAQEAWKSRAAADAAVAALAPEWPTHRQPVIDRNILRLAYCELMAGENPPKAVISEAIELAREFSTEKSPLFINGVLDKIYREHRQQLEAAGAVNNGE
jgi:N utilization substance protein B